MTRERARKIARGLDIREWWTPGDLRLVADAILAVVAEENEACARIASNHKDHESDAVNHARGPSTCPEAIAAEISARLDSMTDTQAKIATGQFWAGRKPGMATVQVLTATADSVEFALQPDNEFGSLDRMTFLRRYRFLEAA